MAKGIPKIKLIVFTDLDGTLLDHYTYSYEAALPALEKIQHYHVPLILISSKTMAEILEIREKLNNIHPFIVENGGAIIIPEGYFSFHIKGDESKDGWITILRSEPYLKIVQILNKIKQDYGFNFAGFNDLTARQVAELTGLSTTEAKKAKQRLCSEPIVWKDSNERLATFQQILAQHNLRLLKGGRFYHALGKTDKGEAAKFLLSLFQKEYPELHFLTVGLGDSPNDRDFLQIVDIPVVIKRPDGTHLQLEGKNEVIYTDEPGPRGWNSAMLKILEDFSKGS